MQYCDTSHYKAEIIFELSSGGKEGRIISFNPPVEILVGVDGWVNYLYLYTNESGNQQWKHVFTFVDGHLFNHPYYDGGGTPLQARNYTYLVRSVAFDENGQIPGGLFKVFPDSLTFLDNGHLNLGNQQLVVPDARGSITWYDRNFNVNAKQINNALTISDTTGLVYFGNYPQGTTPQYEVKCIGCPNGEIAISKDGGEDFICVDKDRVINESRNIGSKINSLMKYLKK